MNEKTSAKVFNYFIFFGMLVCVLIASVINIRNNPDNTALQIVVAVGAMFGVTSTILAAQGNILNFVIGALGAVIETYVLWKNGVTSMFLLYLLYFIPMDVVGFLNWRKRGASVHKEVKAQRMNGRKWLYVALGYIVVAGVAFCISYFAGHNNLGSGIPAKMITDALATSATIVAIVMMTMAYMEQWYIWTLVNISNIVLWSVNLATTPDSAYTVVMLIKYAFYLLNGLNAIRIWLKLSAKEEDLQV
ncbi:MAG: nicotinamide mononucleotide transporter [Bacteroidales bacterium]|nr:nicotinamide mononucleotide transporter [Bacteroidales bacterium]